MEKDSYAEVKHNIYSDNEPIIVSVAMIAYNVGSFIETAIESVLSQKTTYRVELVIGEDCSTDSTRKIALSYRDRYPGIIRVLLPEHNQGLTPNSIVTQNACTGKYIALLDGDDYWTDTGKLQKQIDFLESNPGFSGSAHQSVKIYMDGSKSEHLFGQASESEFDILDTITHRNFHTSSLVYRKSIWDEVGGIPANISSNERAIYPMIAIYGKIKYFKDPMCIYRLNHSGISSRITLEELETDLNMLPWLKLLKRDFPVLRFKSFLHLCIYSYPANSRIFPLVKHFLLFSLLSFSYFPKNLGDVYYGSIELLRIFHRKLSSPAIF